MDCQKCNKPLEVDAKFCTHCGAPVSEETIQRMNEEKPATKTKVFLLKTLAFFIAAFLTFIIKLIFMGMGLIEVSADFMKGGILLFIGLWMLFSGLFLKDTKKKKWGAGLIAAYVIFSFAFGYFYNNSKYGIEQQIIDMGRDTPKKVNENIELSSVRLEDNNVVMNFKLLNASSTEIASDKLEELKNTIKSESCKDESFNKIFEYGKSITISYFGNDNKLILDTQVSKDICNLGVNENTSSNTDISNESDLGVMHPLDTFRIKLHSNNQPKYLKIDVNLESENSSDELYSKNTQVRMIITNILSAQSIKNISSVEGQEKVKQQIMKELNILLKNEKIKGVYFTDFIIE